MSDPICCAIVQNTAREAMTLAGNPECGHGEVAERPIAVPKLRSVKESAAASTAPARTASHSMKPRREPATGSALAVGDAISSMTCLLVQAEEAQASRPR